LTRGRLALLSNFIPAEGSSSYLGKSANLTATLAADGSKTCDKAPSLIKGKGGVSNPRGWCGIHGEDGVPPGEYILTYSEPKNVSFSLWICYDVADAGNPEPLQLGKRDLDVIVTVSGGKRVMCVAEFKVIR
jgi:hypothetical protein